MECLKDGVMSGGFEIVGASSTARRRGDIVVRSLRAIASYDDTCASAADIILHLSVEYLVVVSVQQGEGE